LVQPTSSPRLVEFEIEIEEHPCQDEAHLDICKIATDAVPWTGRERLKDVSSVIDECSIAVFEKAFEEK
jgi:hypothetical protein